VLIAESGAGTTVTESTATSGGDLDTYTIVLTKQPSATVTVTITCNSQVNVNTTGTNYASSTTRTFSTSTGLAGGLEHATTITLRGVSDTYRRGDARGSSDAHHRDLLGIHSWHGDARASMWMCSIAMIQQR